MGRKEIIFLLIFNLQPNFLKEFVLKYMKDILNLITYIENNSIFVGLFFCCEFF